MFRSLAVFTFFLIPSIVHAADGHAPCDFLAAHPDDEFAVADGIPDGDIDTVDAIPQCLEAINEAPETGRFAFQLGRAYWQDDQNDAAVAQFERAALELDHPAAYAYLGIAYEYGYVTGAPEVDFARSLYEIAIDLGFTPAQTLMDALSDAAPRTSGDTRDVPDFALFKQPQILESLYLEDYEKLNEQAVSVVLYLKGMYTYFQQEMTYEDMSCAHLHDTRLIKKILRNLLGSNSVGLSGNVENIASRLLEKIASGNVNDLPNALLGLLDVGILQNEGNRDARKLALDFQCTSDEVRSLYKHAQYFILNEVSLQ